MRNHLVVLFLCHAVAAQEKPAEENGPTANFQDSANLNDERVKVFIEIEVKAKGGDAAALSSIGDYYIIGKYPVNKNPAKAEESWTKGAMLGSEGCASRMIRSFNAGTSSESAIERTKWSAIHHYLMIRNLKLNQTDFKRPEHVSESSFTEAVKRAHAFLARANMATPNQTVRPAPISKNPPALKFGSLQSLDEYRKKTCAAYMKAVSPIYNKGDTATEAEKQIFTSSAQELQALQTYLTKHRYSIALASSNNRAAYEINNKKIEVIYGKITDAKIKVDTPANRTELNEASKFMNALADLMQLPVTLGSY